MRSVSDPPIWGGQKPLFGWDRRFRGVGRLSTRNKRLQEDHRMTKRERARITELKTLHASDGFDPAYEIHRISERANQRQEQADCVYRLFGISRWVDAMTRTA